MKVSEVSITMPLVKGIDKAEDLIVYEARVSNPENQLNLNTAPKLLRYLINKKHWSPFEMVDYTVEIVTSRFIAAQILRHRSFSFQERSQRYANAQGIEPISLRKQAKNNRQSSEEEFNPIVTLHDQQYQADELVSMVTDLTFDAYEALLNADVSRETARSILPLATSTTMYMKGSVRSWIHYFDVRCDEHTQLEHRQVAYEILSLFKHRFPVVSEAMGYE